MPYFIFIKIFVSAVIIAFVSEIAKRHVSLGGLIAAMPITTLLSMIWLYIEKKDTLLVSNFLVSVLGGTLLTFVFFIMAILLLKKGLNFYITIVLSLSMLFIAVTLYNKFIS